MVKKIKEYIKSGENIAVLCHVNADGDALCSSFALKDILSTQGKNVCCILEEIPGSKYKFLGGEYSVYKPGDKTDYDLCIAVDCGSIDRLGSRIEIFNGSRNTINIDHHKSNNNFAELNVVKDKYSAAAEVIAELMDILGFEISDKAAMYLYGGIMSDSGCLKFSSTSPGTLRIAAKLMEHDFDHAYVNRMLFDNNSMEFTRLKGYVMNNIESYEEGKITLISTSSALLSEYGVDERDADALINIPRSIEGAEIAIEIKERGGQIRASLRSNGNAQVDRIAAAFGGGGHIRAAGVTFKDMTFEEAKKALLDAAKTELVKITEV